MHPNNLTDKLASEIVLMNPDLIISAGYYQKIPNIEKRRRNYNILSQINSPDDLKKLNHKSLQKLSSEKSKVLGCDEATLEERRLAFHVTGSGINSPSFPKSNSPACMGDLRPNA